MSRSVFCPGMILLVRKIKEQEEGKIEGEEKQGRTFVLDNRTNSLLGPEVMGCQPGELQNFIAIVSFCDKRNFWTLLPSDQGRPWSICYSE